ncbi:MAG: PAS domain-containing protein [Nitriliruptorales bacterium]|nr:PAS domain-containing protein [Nitriliruptorales bacterium]
MIRRSLVLVPLAAAAAGAIAAMLRLPPGWAAAIGAILGLLAAVGLSLVSDRRLEEVATRIRRFARGEPVVQEEVRGSRAWRRLVGELAEVGQTLQQRYDAVARERARVEHLLDSMPTAILLFDAVGLTYANPAAQQMFGVRRRQMRSPLQVLGVEALANAVVEARETGQGVSVEVQRGDRHLTAQTTIADHDVVALVVTDVTDSRRLEAIRRDFVTNASHELRTPVAGMQALADSLGVAIDRDPVRARSMVVRLQIEATRLGKLARELLDLARLEEDAAAERRRVDLAEIVRAQAERILPLAQSRDVKVSVHADAPAPLVALPGDVRLIVANLLENAVRYNRPGGHVDVTVERTASHAILEVEDDGLGIADADRDRIFERFYRVDRARSRAGGGTGLGLSIVRHATERHGGQVSVQSVLGEGSTFRVVLPVEGTRADPR